VLAELGLACNGLGPAAAEALGACLATNLRLRRLDLQANSLGPGGARLLAAGLRANRGRLSSLDCSQNGLLLPGARDLAECFPAQAFRLSIRLRRPWGASIGAKLDNDLKVTGIEISGLIETWNAANTSEEVFIGDQVVQVNDKSTPEEMLDEMTSQDDLEITMLRPHGGLTYLDLCHNGVTLAGAEELRELLGRPQEGSLQGWHLRFDGGARQVLINAA